MSDNQIEMCQTINLNSRHLESISLLYLQLAHAPAISTKKLLFKHILITNFAMHIKKENFHIVVYVSKNPMHCMCLGLAGCIGGYWKRTEPGTHIVTFLHTDTNKASTIQEDLN